MGGSANGRNRGNTRRINSFSFLHRTSTSIVPPKKREAEAPRRSRPLCLGHFHPARFRLLFVVSLFLPDDDFFTLNLDLGFFLFFVLPEDRHRHHLLSIGDNDGHSEHLIGFLRGRDTSRHCARRATNRVRGSPERLRVLTDWQPENRLQSRPNCASVAPIHFSIPRIGG